MKRLFGDAYNGTKVLVTGHTGFKGSWLVRWLTLMGADVSGLALAPATEPNHWDFLRTNVRDHRRDIRDPRSTLDVISEEKPDIIFHLAAQPLVRASYADPFGTWTSNLSGTVNLLDACRRIPSLRALVVATTDKVYEERERPHGYRETDPLGGHDPYSASKAACEIAVDSYRKSFFAPVGVPLTATVRAGNVIGGGDWSDDRLVPDIIRSIETGAPLEIRSPDATRPWQHVLDCLSGYLLIGARLLEGKNKFAEAWNFGPDQTDCTTVRRMLDLFAPHCPGLLWKDVSDRRNPHEAPTLSLDTEKARAELDWRPVWTLEKAVFFTASWYHAFMQRGEIRTEEHLEQYVQDAVEAGLPWAIN